MNHLLLIDSRINDIDLVTQSLLPNVDSILVNYQEDTFLTLVSKIPQKKYNTVGIFHELRLRLGLAVADAGVPCAIAAPGVSGRFEDGPHTSMA